MPYSLDILIECSKTTGCNLKEAFDFEANAVCENFININETHPKDQAPVKKKISQNAVKRKKKRKK